MATFAKLDGSRVVELKEFDIVPVTECRDWVPVRREVGTVAGTIIEPRLVRIVEPAPVPAIQEPDAAIEALKAMAAKMQAMEQEAAELKRRLAQVETPLHALAAEAKRRMEAA